MRAQVVSPEAIGDIVVRAMRQMESELRHGAILTIDADHARLRLLPLTGKT